MEKFMENWKKFILKEAVNVEEIQKMIDNNEFLKGKVVAKNDDVIEGKKFVLLFSSESAKHIAERHLDGKKPGSLFNSNIDLREIAKKLIDQEPSEKSGGRVKWLAADAKVVLGKMGVKKASPEQVLKMKDYQMPDGAKEVVKISAGQRDNTSEANLITAELGQLSDGRKALSLITMFPGGKEVDGVAIPANRAEFAKIGLYFVVDSDSEILKESKNTQKITKSYLRKLIKESLDVYELIQRFFGEIESDEEIGHLSGDAQEGIDKVKEEMGGQITFEAAVEGAKNGMKMYGADAASLNKVQKIADQIKAELPARKEIEADRARMQDIANRDKRGADTGDYE